MSKGTLEWLVQKLEIEKRLLELAIQEEKVGSQNTLVALTSSVTLIEISRFSSYKHLIRSFACALRFCVNLKSPEKRKDSLVSEEIKYAENRIFKVSQSCLS